MKNSKFILRKKSSLGNFSTFLNCGTCFRLDSEFGGGKVRTWKTQKGVENFIAKKMPLAKNLFITSI